MCLSESLANGYTTVGPNCDHSVSEKIQPGKEMSCEYMWGLQILIVKLMEASRQEVTKEGREGGAGEMPRGCVVGGEKWRKALLVLCTILQFLQYKCVFRQYLRSTIIKTLFRELNLLVTSQMLRIL